MKSQVLAGWVAELSRASAPRLGLRSQSPGEAWIHAFNDELTLCKIAIPHYLLILYPYNLIYFLYNRYHTWFYNICLFVYFLSLSVKI